ncbi:MAG: DUF4445 domain-containing protein [Firmicutes bacterium]|nr:DUF4445 domain-containing protein [Bacillota bacterium]
MKLSDALNIPLDCGGKGRCGKCKVYVSGQLSPLTQAETSLLTQEEIDAGCRLACQTEIEGEYVVHKTHKEDDMVIQTGFGAVDSGISSSLSPAPSNHIGVAVDIGTTTLAAYWYDLTCGQLIDQRSSANPQRIFGADVISRIERAMAGDLMQLSAVLRRGILELLPEKWDRLVLTGNTTMLYTLCGHNPEPLSHAPFIADHTYGYEKDGVILAPCFSAYVGADLSTAALAAGLWKDGRLALDKPTLLLDAGTNGEILLAANGHLYGCATACGPAFEGSQISCGLPSVPGAICHVKPDFSVETIGGKPPKGYCGSGILDVTAALLDSELLDETGFLDEWPEEATALPELTQKDIREIQLAKSAIAAGCDALMHAAGVTELDTIYLAGGFGSQLNVESARRIGLIPPARNTVAIGNGAGYGAALLLLDPSLLNDLLSMKAQFELVELANDPYFSEAFMNHMYFPEID